MLGTQKLKSLPVYVLDLAAISATAVVVFLISDAYDLFEMAEAKAVGVEHELGFQLDELFIVAIFLMFAFGMFAIRRWRETLQLIATLEQTVSKEHFRQLADAMPQIVWEAAPDGQVQYYNQRWFDYSGRTLEQSKGFGWSDLLHPEDVQPTVDAWTKAVEAGQEYTASCRVKCASDGIYRWHLVRGVPFYNSQRKLEGWIGTCTDVADLKAATEAAQAANRAKSEFLANMSHEIRTPMNAIIGMTDLVLDGDLSDEQRENLEIVKTSSHLLLRIINDILDFSKIEAGKLELDYADFDLGKLLNDTVKSISVRAHEKGLELACRIAAQVPNGLVGDSLRLQQVLVNLLGNAIKFTQHGEIVLTVESEMEADNQVRLHFSVRDTGVGISAEHQQKIFEAFTQADGTSTRRFGGTGLGLAISAQLVGLMEGHIWVDSELGNGSIFHFTALLGVSSASNFPGLKASGALTDLRVLIVDDNATNRLILEEAVFGWRMRSTCVDNGASALETLRRAEGLGQPFAFMLLDAMMPDMDGFEVARRCQAESGLRGVTIMMLSSADIDGDAARCRELGITRYLRKPISATELHGAMLAAFDRATSKNSKKPAKRSSATTTEGTVPCLNILLAEDNVVNQRVTVRILEKRGHTIQPVLNGKEAIEALACERFDLMLMDVQMPVMDGLEATAAIRASERETGQHIPIIAMTAHAMTGDREHCLEAGMDDYLSKPVEPKSLHAVLERWGAWTKQHSSGEECTHINRPSTTDSSLTDAEKTTLRNDLSIETEVFNFAALRDRVENDLDLLMEMIDLYLSSSPQMMKEIESAVADGNTEKISRAAHTLKGVLRNMCASTCAEAAFQLETIGKAGESERASESLAVLKNEFQRLESTLTTVGQRCKS